MMRYTLVSIAGIVTLFYLGLVAYIKYDQYTVMKAFLQRENHRIAIANQEHPDIWKTAHPMSYTELNAFLAREGILPKEEAQLLDQIDAMRPPHERLIVVYQNSSTPTVKVSHDSLEPYMNSIVNEDTP